MPLPSELYAKAVEHYEFQSQFNWSRTQYLLGFNVAILVAGSAVAAQPGRSAALVYVAGMVAAVLSGFVVRTQHGYYRAARDRLGRVEEELAVPDELRMDTTVAGGAGRLVSVTQVVYLLLGLISVSDAVGAVIILAR